MVAVVVLSAGPDIFSSSSFVNDLFWGQELQFNNLSKSPLQTNIIRF